MAKQQITLLATLFSIFCSPFTFSQSTDPGASITIEQKLVTAKTDKKGQYEIRTSHRLPDGEPKYSNRLLLENSPYLLQHAHNPVNWFPWGDEAFAMARKENKPVFHRRPMAYSPLRKNAI